MAPHSSTQGTFRRGLRELQRAPLVQRKRWLTAASAVAMVAVVALWVLYLNLTLPTPEQRESPPAAPEKPPGDAFGKTLGRGFSAISDDIMQEWERVKEETAQTLRTLREALERQNQFTVEGGNAISTSTPHRTQLGAGSTSTPPERFDRPESFDLELKTEGLTTEGLAPSDAEGLPPVPAAPLPQAPAKGENR